MEMIGDDLAPSHPCTSQTDINILKVSEIVR